MSVTVTDKIKAILATQKEAEALGVERVLALLDELRGQIITELVGIPSGSYSDYSLRSSLASIEKHLADWESAVKREVGTGLADSWEAGKSILPVAAQAAELGFAAPWISSHTLDALKDFTFGKISGVRSDLFTRIKGELTLGILGQKTPQEIAGELAEGIKNVPIPKIKRAGPLFGHPIFKSVAERAEVITGLEMGRAFSIATEKSIEAAQETIPELQRMWLHAGHPKSARIVHVYMHGQVRKVGKAFFTSAAGGVPVYYPRAPGAPVSEVIR